MSLHGSCVKLEVGNTIVVKEEPVKILEGADITVILISGFTAWWRGRERAFQIMRIVEEIIGLVGGVGTIWWDKSICGRKCSEGKG